MASKINVTENIAIIIEKQKIEVVTTLNYDMSISFDNKDAAPTLDENGDLFEPVYKCKVQAIPKNDVFFTSLTRVKSNIKTLQEVKKFFEFVNENRENLFDSMSGIVFQDDGQIALHDVGKFYSLNPRIEVEVEVMEPLSI